jgi:hypothetical protein
VSRILPSQAAAVIEVLFPDLLKSRGPAEPAPTIRGARHRHVAGVLAVLAEVPTELLQLSGADLARLIIARVEAEKYVEEVTRGHVGVTMTGDVMLRILELVKRCPDQAVPASTEQLIFLNDPQLRESLRVDIAEVSRAIVDAEWKSATVMCGSVIEALLLWRLNQDAPAAQQSAITLGLLKRAKPLDEWDLYHYIEVAEALGVIARTDTAPQLRLAKDFRNLIHPGRAVRLARRCDQPTALAAAAGLGFLIRDLS